MRLRLMALMALALSALSALPAHAQDVLSVPPLSGRVMDQSGTLSDAQQQALTAKLAAFEQATGTQLAVLLVPTTHPEDDAAYAQRVADAWKLGRRGVGDGLLLLVAKNDRRIRIEVAKSLEGAIPDLAAHRIIVERMQPAFRAGDYAGGLNAAVDALAARVKGEGLPAPESANAADRVGIGGLAVFALAAAPLLTGVLGAMLGRRVGVLAGGAGMSALGWFFTGSLALTLMLGVGGLIMGLFTSAFGSAARRGNWRSSSSGGPVVWGSSGSGGWSGGSGGGGGFSSGGGGDFGGGGASGDW